MPVSPPKELWQMKVTGKEYSCVPIEAVDRVAFGFAEEDVKTLNPDQLTNIKWSQDYLNVIEEQKRSGLSPKDWAQTIDLSEPIDVVYEEGHFWIDDGHHRYYAALILDKPLNVSVTIKDKPHKVIVEKALRAGKPVPPEVLADYPDLASRSEIISYVGNHEAPTHDSGSPAYDLSGIYPEDFYGPKGAQYYGHYGQLHPRDVETVGILRQLRNRPNAKVTIYRAVPKVLSNEELISQYEKEKKYILKYGKPPSGASGHDYDWLCDEIERLKAAPSPVVPKYHINRGDWVTINRKYAVEHGESQLDGKYSIISKVVRAKDIFTSGESIHEWGYEPQMATASKTYTNILHVASIGRLRVIFNRGKHLI